MQSNGGVIVDIHTTTIGLLDGIHGLLACCTATRVWITCAAIGVQCDHVGIGTESLHQICADYFGAVLPLSVGGARVHHYCREDVASIIHHEIVDERLTDVRGAFVLDEIGQDFLRGAALYLFREFNFYSTVFALLFGRINLAQIPQAGINVFAIVLEERVIRLVDIGVQTAPEAVFR